MVREGGEWVQDVEGFCAILEFAGHKLLTKEIPISAPRLGDLHADARREVIAVYRDLEHSSIWRKEAEGKRARIEATSCLRRYSHATPISSCHITPHLGSAQAATQLDIACDGRKSACDEVPSNAQAAVD